MKIFDGQSFSVDALLASEADAGSAPAAKESAVAPLASEPASVLGAAGGISVGTSRVVAATVERDGSVALRAERNAFVELEDDAATRRFLSGLGVPSAARDGRLVVVGDAAVEVARLLSRETRRPMRDGVVSPDEPDALFRLASLFERTVGRAANGERAAFSVPSDAASGGDPRIVYHRSVVASALSRLGYRPMPVSEGLAVVLAELADEEFTGVGVSFGAGRTSVSIAHRGIEVEAFSLDRAGDWIDRHAATALSIAEVRASAAKEGGIDLEAPRGREAEAIAALVKNGIGLAVEAIRARLRSSGRARVFGEPLTVMASGGGAMAAGFAAILAMEIEKDGGIGLPVRRVRVAAAPLESVARGCLVAAALSDD